MFCPGWQKWHGMFCPVWQIGMGYFVRGDKNCMGCFVRGGKSMRDVLSGVAKNGMGWFVPGCFVLHSITEAVVKCPGNKVLTCPIICLPAHINPYVFFWDIYNQCRSRSDTANMESDQGRHCLLSKFTIINGAKIKNTTKYPLNGNGQAQLIIVGHSILLKWINEKKYNHG